MTELSYLLDLLLNHKLPRATKLSITERIGLIQSHTQAPMLQRQGIIAQAPSTQKLIDAASAGIAEAAPVVMAASKRIIGGEVSTGNGTKGPRKF